MTSTPGFASPPAFYLLMKEPADHLGQVLDQFLPAVAEALAEQGATCQTLPVADGMADVELRLAPPLRDAALSADAALSPEREEVTVAAAAHRGVVRITPQHGSPLRVQLDAAAAMTLALSERDDVLAVWVPTHRNLRSPSQWGADIGEQTWFRTHAVRQGDRAAVLVTRGLSAFGHPEVQLRLEDASPSKVERLRLALANRVMAGIDETNQPTLGTSVRLHGRRYDARPARGVVDGEDVLDLTSTSGGGLLGRLKGSRSE